MTEYTIQHSGVLQGYRVFMPQAAYKDVVRFDISLCGVLKNVAGRLQDVLFLE